MMETNIRKYAKLMKELDLTGLEVTEDNRALRLERTKAGDVDTPSGQTTFVLRDDHETAKPISEEKEYFPICSPMVGVFYAASAENAEPFVKVGDRVKKGDTLCIVEAMKLMNEITAEQDGVVAEICAKNAQVVEYGSELIRMKRG